MAQYKINADGTKTVVSRYSRKGVCTLNSIFPDSPATPERFLKKKKGYENVNLQKKYGLHNNSVLVRRIFTKFLLKVLDRVAAGDLFMMPGKTQANITLKSIPDEEVKKLRQKGFYSDYDIVKAGFKIPKFSYDYGPFNGKRDIGIHVPPDIKRKSLRLAENKQIAWSYIPKTFNRDV